MDLNAFIDAYGRTVSRLPQALAQWPTVSESGREQLADSLLLMLVRRGEALQEAEEVGEAYLLRRQLEPLDSVLRVNAAATLKLIRIEVWAFLAPTATSVTGEMATLGSPLPELSAAA